MADTPPEDGPVRSDDTAKLELPSLNPFRRRRRHPKPVAEPEPASAPDPVAGAAPGPVAEPEPFGTPEPVPEPVAEPEPLDEPEPVAALEPVAEPEPVAETAVLTSPDAPTEAPGQRKAPRARPSLPTLPGWVAALVGGLVVGAFGAGLTWVSLVGCDAVRGTQSCGGAGVLVIFVILVLMVLFGGLVLALLHLSDAKATSFLAVGVLLVVVLLTPQDALFSPWMFLVVPLVSAAAFVLAHWVTATFVEPRPEKGPAHDVR